MYKQKIKTFAFRSKTFKYYWEALLQPAYPDVLREITQVPLVLNYVGNKPGVVLEIAPGEGMFTRRLISKSNKYFAIGLNRVNSKKITDNKPEKLLYTCADAQSLPFPANTFDTVLCTEVLEHICNDYVVVKEIARVLKPGRVAIISTPVPPAPCVDPEHVREGYTLDMLRELLEKQGLEIQAWRYCLYGFSRFAIRLGEYWRTKMPVRLPRIIMLGLGWLDRIFGNYNNTLPYDIVIKAVKPY
jgi:SAM-dependent methyltransferase